MKLKLTYVLAVVLGLVVSAGAAFGQAASTGGRRTLAESPCGKSAPVDLNAGSAEEIAEAIPGVGPAKAAALIAARPLKTWADVDAVRGIGAATLAAVQRCAKDPAGAAKGAK